MRKSGKEKLAEAVKKMRYIYKPEMSTFQISFKFRYHMYMPVLTFTFPQIHPGKHSMIYF